jgi:hypothetical protein
LAGRERCHGCSRIAGALSYRAAAKSVNDVFGIAVQFPVVGVDPACEHHERGTHRIHVAKQRVSRTADA